MNKAGSDGPHAPDAAGGSPGNDERMTFLYDSRKVSLGGLAGELVLPPLEPPDGCYVPVSQIWPTPYICGFKAGWTRFMLATVHGFVAGEVEMKVSSPRDSRALGSGKVTVVPGETSTYRPVIPAGR